MWCFKKKTKCNFVKNQIEPNWKLWLYKLFEIRFTLFRFNSPFSWTFYDVSLGNTVLFYFWSTMINKCLIIVITICVYLWLNHTQIHKIYQTASERMHRLLKKFLFTKQSFHWPKLITCFLFITVLVPLGFKAFFWICLKIFYSKLQ